MTQTENVTKLEALRKERGITREKLAAMAGVSVKTIQNHERGGMQTHWAIRQVIANALDVKVDDAFAAAGQDRKPS